MPFKAGAFAAFFNQSWEKKGESEEAYAQFIEDQHKRFILKQKNEARRELPELPPAKQEKGKHRQRCHSERMLASPRTRHKSMENQFSSKSELEDPDIEPYAEMNAIRNSVFLNSRSTEELSNPTPYATSTPNTFLANNLHPAGNNPATPRSCLEWEKRELADSRRKDDIYAVVDLSRKRSFRKSKGVSMDDSEVNLIENSLYANKNLAQSQRSSESDSRNTPPPLPERHYGLTDFGLQLPTSRTDTIRSGNSLDDEGYSTIQKDQEAQINRTNDPRYEEVRSPMDKKYEEVSSPDQTSSSRNESTSGPDPYTMSFNSKLEFFNKKNYNFLAEIERNIPQDVWVKRDVKQGGSRTSYPNLLRQPSYGPRAPLAQQEVIVHRFVM